MWRGTTYQKPLFTGSTLLISGNPAVQLIVYPISQCDQNGQALINWAIKIALKEYEKNRLSKTSKIVESNRNKNQTAIFKLIEAHCDGNCGAVHRCVDSQTLNTLVEDYKKQTGARA